MKSRESGSETLCGLPKQSRRVCYTNDMDWMRPGTCMTIGITSFAITVPSIMGLGAKWLGVSMSPLTIFLSIAAGIGVAWTLVDCFQTHLRNRWEQDDAILGFPHRNQFIRKNKKLWERHHLLVMESAPSEARRFSPRSRPGAPADASECGAETPG